MAFHHRKLIFESLDNSTGKTCSSYYCNAKENPSEICPLSCLYVCYPICSFPLFSEIQPPLPPNFFTPKIPLPQSPHKPTISIFLIILFSVLATSFFIFCCFIVYKFRNSRILSQRQQQVEEDDEFSDIVDEDIYRPMVDHPIWYIRTVGLQPSVISAITICKYKRGEGLIEGTDCSVCLSEFQEDETLRILPPCNHAFHIPCIDTWLRSHTNCPMCRAGIVIATTAPSPSPEQNLGLRHEEETRSENATELRIEIENEGDSANISSMDISGNSKEDVGDGNEGELGEFYASRIPASSESLSTAFMTSASTDANEQSTDQNSSEESIEVNDSEMGTYVSHSSFDVNESSSEKRNFCVDRVMEKEQMRSLSFSTR
ncbi:RING-H2 finger protein ATL54-like [Nicotiana tabacum]|uniref:RING-type E3 ubiquitin transferase n=1 Tax=Nicotiana tabacum TaxID=4097 RepID=A0A1S4A7K8_TOBAC|nr:PREDICTED: RING-H2 finger protein ATL54-like [Nicotiana tabacum]